MQDQTPPCSLCGQPVLISGFSLLTPEGQKKFCCEGCLSIFQLLNPEQSFSKPSSEKSS